jgi:hypothetical protein
VLLWRVTCIAGASLVLASLLAILGGAADPPYVIEGAPTEVTFEEDVSFGDLNLYDVFADDDPEDENLAFSYFEVEHIHMDLDQSTGDVLITNEEDWNGQEEVVFRATDGRGYIADHAVTVNVLAVNDPPEALGKIPREVWCEGQSHQFNVSAFFTDADGDALYYYVHFDPEELYSITNRNDDHRNPLFDMVPVDPMFYGYLQVRFTAYDKDPETHPYEALSANHTAIFEVRGGERPPESVPQSPRSALITINETESVSFSIGDANHPISSGLRIKWTVNGELLADGHVTEFRYPSEPSYLTAGTYKVTAYIIDEIDYHAYRDPAWTLTIVNVNLPPEVDLVNERVRVDQEESIILNVTATDPDGDALTFHWFERTGKNRTKFIGEGQTFIFVNDLDPGEHQFRCEVRDGNDTVTSDWMTVTVEDPPSWSMTNVIALVTGVAVVWGIIIWLRFFHKKTY